MTSNLQYQETWLIPAPLEEVYDRLDSHDYNGDQKPVETHVIAGQPRTVGYSQQARFHHGSLDLILIETITHAERPFRLVVEQQPDCIQRHNPSERDIPFMDALIEDLDAEFAFQFGDPPLITEIAFDLSAHPDGTSLHVTVSVPNARKVGWFGQRKWRKRVQQQLSGIKAWIAP